MKRKIIFALLALTVAIVIFWFSNQSARESQAQSTGFIYLFLSRFLSDGISSKLSYLVRKCAHFCVYALLGGFVCGSLAENKSFFRIFCISQIICMFYAATDEIHQYFIPGRACRLSDVALDSLGSACGIVIMLFVFFLIYRFKKVTRDNI